MCGALLNSGQIRAYRATDLELRLARRDERLDVVHKPPSTVLVNDGTELLRNHQARVQSRTKPTGLRIFAVIYLPGSNSWSAAARVRRPGARPAYTYAHLPHSPLTPHTAHRTPAPLASFPTCAYRPCPFERPMQLGNCSLSAARSSPSLPLYLRPDCTVQYSTSCIQQLTKKPQLPPTHFMYKPSASAMTARGQ
ncbi:hypothetical protein CALCODRAFT_322721 [Calocera cornea HHB12733]|uniref:Uncharacterized protein n=1 Tax=Calocera cornea HHB12733 TaxID=1353952 RepID=A0A165F568_9BASI|nr:hypothetical protein CALCODRAFT_322721 [Calocera cornea HHB12733]